MTYLRDCINHYICISILFSTKELITHVLRSLFTHLGDFHQPIIVEVTNLTIGSWLEDHLWSIFNIFQYKSEHSPTDLNGSFIILDFVASVK